MTVSRTICLGFLALITAGTLLLSLPFAASDSRWDWQHLIVAIFTATSAVCVTGHIVVDTGTYFSAFGQAVILGLIQVGGLGYMTVTTFLLVLLGRRFSLKNKIAVQQALDRTSMQGAAGLIKSIIATTLIFELTGAFLLTAVFAPRYGVDRGLWLGLFHSVSAWNNAGFSLFPNNLVDYQGSLPLNLIIPGLIIFGGLGYETLFELYLRIRDYLAGRREPFSFSLNYKVAVSTTLILLIGGAIAFLLVEARNPNTLGSTVDLPTKIMMAWFQTTTCRTAGFNSIDIGKMTTAGLFISIALMFVGGSPGGTAGGIKTTTLRVLTSCTKAILRGREEVNLYQRQVPLSLVLKAIGVVVGSATTVVLMTVLISLTDPQVGFIQVLFEVVSAFGTVGLSTGITAGLSVFAKLVLVATMYIGRVGVLLLMAAMLGDPKPSFIHYPEENLLVG